MTKTEMLEQQLRGLIDLHQHTINVVQESAAELHRLANYEAAHKEWIEKTEWVQASPKLGELGMHRADVLRKRICDLEIENARLQKLISKGASNEA